MDADRVRLARRVLEILASASPVPSHDALQLRKWAVKPEDATLPLAQIARAILNEEENPNADR